MSKLQIIKIVVSVSLIGFIIYSVELEDIAANLSTMNIWLVILAFSILVIQFPVSTIKWRTSLNIHGLDYGFGFLQKVLCIGFFFNNFLPTSIGGDGYRIYKTMPAEGYRSRSLSAVLLERVGGLAVLLIFGLFGAVVVLSEIQPMIVVNYTIAAVVGIISLLIVLLIIRYGLFTEIINKLKNIKKFDIIVHNLGHIRGNTASLNLLIAQSILFQLMAVLVIYILFHSIGIDAAFPKCAFIAAIVGIASVIPLSINGIGIVEGAFVVAAVQVGIDYNQAVIVALAMRVFVFPLSLICGLVYLYDTRNS